jgi:DNA-binding CsgD family transcriptional regulator
VNSDYYAKANIPYSINKILLLEDGNLLLATSNDGLVEFSRSTSTYRNMIPAAIIGAITGMQFDTCSVLWLTSPNGLFSYNYKTDEIRNHTYRVGSQRSEYSCIFRLHDGTFVVGWNGVVFIDPYFKRESYFKSPLVFLELSVNDRQLNPGDMYNNRIILEKSIAYAEKFELKHSENIFSVSFAELDFLNAKSVEYRYKLEGFDKDWHYTDTEKAFATYTNLDPGQYTLVVEGTDSEKRWKDASSASISILIVPSFWQTLWFKAIVLLVILWLVYIFYRQKIVEKEKEVEHLLNEKLQDEIKNKEKILSAKNSELTSMVVHITNKNEILNEIRRETKAIGHASTFEEVKKIIVRMNNQVDRNLSTDRHWEQFEIHFNQLHDNFLEKLKKKYPGMTQNNLRLCAYLRMNLSTKEIASLMNISPDAVLKSKYRLKLKLRLDDHQDLMDFVLSK